VNQVSEVRHFGIRFLEFGLFLGFCRLDSYTRSCDRSGPSASIWSWSS